MSETVTYDENNIFAKILRGEIPCSKVYENEHALAFEDVAPWSPVHVLIIPKGKYVSIADFSEKASDAEIVGFNRAINEVAKLKNVVGSGYRTVSNHGTDAHQEVPHFHLHLLAGRAMGPLLLKNDSESRS